MSKRHASKTGEMRRQRAGEILSSSPSGRVAEQLRDGAAALDEVTHARMERSLLEAWHTAGARNISLPPRRLRTPGHWTWAGSVAASAVAGAVLGFLLIDMGPDAPPTDSARFELRIGDAAVQNGSISEGQTLESGRHGRINVSIGHSRLDLSKGSKLRFDRVAADELRLSLSTGKVDIEFHPDGPAAQRMSVHTRAARVLVVGTKFSVEVDAVGNTEVNVAEGVVEVVPENGGDAQRITAGQHAYVRVDEGDDFERALRSAMEESLAEAELEPAPAAPSEQPAPAVEAQDSTTQAHAPRPRMGPSMNARLEAARALLRQGKHANAREKLRVITDSAVAIRYRVESLTLIAESYTAQGYIPRAADSYRRAAHIAPGHPAGHNALFALARLLERYTLDGSAAVSAYERYLNQTPNGALAPQARQALCRLDGSCK